MDFEKIDFTKINLEKLKNPVKKKLHLAMAVNVILFMKVILPYSFIIAFAAFHRALIEVIKNPKNKEIAILIFRKAGKTTIFIVVALWKIMYQGYQHIVFASETERTAKYFLRCLKQVVLSDRFKKLFGDCKGEKWSVEEIEIESKKLGIHAFVAAKGIDSQHAGSVAYIDGKFVRPQIILGDDIDVDENLTAERVEAMVNWYDGTLLPSLDDIYKPSFIFIIGTTFNVLSLLTVLQKRDSVQTLRFPLLPDFEEDKKIFEELGIPEGESMWETHPNYNYEEANKIKQGYIKKGKYYIFCAQYLLHPYVSTATRFKEEQLKFFLIEDYRSNDMVKIDFPNWNLYLLIDSAYKKGPKNDESGFALIGVDVDNNFYIIETHEEKLGDKAFYTKIAYFFQKYHLTGNNFKMIGVESTFFDHQRLLIMEELKGIEVHNVIIQELKPGNAGKADRIRLLIHPSEEGRFHINEKLTEFRQKILLFDAEGDVKHFNALDAASYIWTVGRPPSNVNLEEVQEEMERQIWHQICEQMRFFDRQTVNQLSPFRKKNSPAAYHYPSLALYSQGISPEDYLNPVGEMVVWMEI